MTKLLIAIFIVLLISCTHEKQKQAFPTVHRSDINQIVEAFIRQDTIHFHKSSDSSFIPLSIHFRKIVVTAQDTMPDIPSPFSPYKVPVYQLLNTLVRKERFFGWKDTSYFYFQNNLVNTFTLDTTVTAKIATINFDAVNKRNETKRTTRYFDLTIPIFSKNQTRAYIELIKNCIDCGGATAFYLEKIKSEWTVVGWNRLWMN